MTYINEFIHEPHTHTRRYNRLIRIKIKSKDFVRQAYLYFSYIEIHRNIKLLLIFTAEKQNFPTHDSCTIKCWNFTNKSVEKYRPRHKATFGGTGNHGPRRRRLFSALQTLLKDGTMSGNRHVILEY